MNQRAFTVGLLASSWLACALILCSSQAHADDPIELGVAVPTVDPNADEPSGAPPIRVPSGAAKAEPTSAPVVPGIDYHTKRIEIAGAPLIGGNSDIGFEFGAVGTITQFANDVIPYRWNMDIVLSASLKDGPSGIEIAQQNYLLQIDIPDLVPDKLRLKLTASYQRTVDQGYFGLGNASSSTLPRELTGQAGRYFQFDQREAMLRSLSRIVLRHPFDLMVATNFRFVAPSAYDGSRLAQDAAQGSTRGLRALVPLAAAVGVGYDTRDNEFFPYRGAFHQFGIKATYSWPASASVHYGAVGGIFAGYVPIGGPFVFAARAVVDAQFGHVPFYDLYTGGIFQTAAMPGGPEGVRGVPLGRYLGLIKALANAELRALPYEFHLLGTPFHLGGNIFADTGRVWKDYHFGNAADGGGVGLQWGTGAGLLLQWGQAAIFRAEVAYSPAAAAVNPKFPLGVYVADGVMF